MCFVGFHDASFLGVFLACASQFLVWFILQIFTFMVPLRRFLSAEQQSSLKARRVYSY